MVILCGVLLSNPWDGWGKKQLDIHKNMPSCPLDYWKPPPDWLPFGEAASKSMRYIGILCSLQEFHPHVSSQISLSSSSNLVLSQVPDHPIKPSTTAHSLMQILTLGYLSVQPQRTTKDVLELLPMGRISLNHSFRDTMLTLCSHSPQVGADVSRTVCKPIWFLSFSVTWSEGIPCESIWVVPSFKGNHCGLVFCALWRSLILLNLYGLIC